MDRTARTKKSVTKGQNRRPWRKLCPCVMLSEDALVRPGCSFARPALAGRTAYALGGYALNVQECISGLDT